MTVGVSNERGREQMGTRLAAVVLLCVIDAAFVWSVGLA
jgi:hypothetical protein